MSLLSFATSSVIMVFLRTFQSEKVLKKAGLEGAHWADPDSVPAIYKASLPSSCPARFAVTSMPILTPMTMSSLRRC
jgi:hypothetical protein